MTSVPGLISHCDARLVVRRSTLAAVAAVALCSAAFAGAHALPHSLAAGRPGSVSHIGTGADEVWILRPRGRAVGIVVFGHGWSTPLPSGFAPWLSHLRDRGQIVIYPRYRLGAGDSSVAALRAFRNGIEAAFRALGPVRLPIVAVGKSFGGSAIFYYASEASAWGVPGPRALLSVFPALPVGRLPTRTPPAGVEVDLLVGDADTTAGSAGADAFVGWLRAGPPRQLRYGVVRSVPGFVANHDSAQRADRPARSAFWRPADLLIERARLHGPG